MGGMITSIGKAKPLTGDLSGFYSRRIDDKNRLVYREENSAVVVLLCWYRYSDH